jgi:hypothetical protein
MESIFIIYAQASHRFAFLCAGRLCQRYTSATHRCLQSQRISAVLKSKTGSAKIVGQAFLKTVGGDVKYGAGDTVWLHPVTSLTNEWFTKHIVQGVPLAAGNPHSYDFRRQAIADAEGRFEFDALPPGDYYLTCSITWGVPSDIGTMPTGGIAYAKVSVRNGETTKAIVTR